MIWGEVINSVRRLHLYLVQEHSVDPALFTRDIVLPSPNIPFPDSVDDFEEWEELPLPPDLQDLLPLHPVERALIEGSLLPIQIIRFSNPDQIESLFSSILDMEKNWLQIIGSSTSPHSEAIQNFLRAEILKLKARAGFRSLSPAKESKK